MTRLIVIIGFLVAFAAGFVVGNGFLASRQINGAGSTTRPSREGWLDRELNLDAKQKQQMREIWSEAARGGGREHEEKRRQLRKERDEAIAALVGTDNKARYDEIQQTYSDQMAAQDKEMRDRFRKLQERTKEILTPEQRTKYEELMRRHDRDHDGRRGDDRPMSRPTSP